MGTRLFGQTTKVGLAIILWWVMAMATTTAPATGAAPAGAHRLLGYTDGAALPALTAELERLGWQPARHWPALRLMELAPMPGVQTAAVLDALPATAGAQVRFVAEDEVVVAAGEIVATPAGAPVNDPLAGQQWALARVGLGDGWTLTRGEPRVIVAVIDTGLSFDHPDLSPASLWTNLAEASGRAGVDDDGNGFVDDRHGWDWVDGDAVADDEAGHGTHVAGAIVAVADNHTGITGMAPGLGILPLRILDRAGRGSVSDLVDAIVYAQAAGARIVNLSLVLGGHNDALLTAIQWATAQNMMVVAAAGNSSEPVVWPAAYAETVAVAATTETDQRASFSNYGPQVDLAAPGANILGLYRNGEYEYLSGTSMATPHVSALAGLLMTLRPDLDAVAVTALMQATADDVNAAFLPGKDDELGAGRINGAAALLRASEALALVETATPPDYLFIGSSYFLGVRVTAPPGALAQRRAVQGAVIHYTLRKGSAPAEEALISGSLLTDAGGTAGAVIALPGEAGFYVLELWVGNTRLRRELQVVNEPTTITVTAPAPVVAGSGEQTVTIALLDAAGQPVAGPVPIGVTVTRGLLSLPLDPRANAGTGAQPAAALRAVAQDGSLALVWLPGTGAGSGQFRVESGTRSAVAGFRIEPGVVAMLQVTQLASTHFEAAKMITVTLDAQLADRYGNSAGASAGQAFYAWRSAGDDTVYSATTTTGDMRYALPLPLLRTEPVTVTVTAVFSVTASQVAPPLPATQRLTSTSVVAPVHFFFLPAVERGVP